VCVECNILHSLRVRLLDYRLGYLILGHGQITETLQKGGDAIILILNLIIMLGHGRSYGFKDITLTFLHFASIHLVYIWFEQSRSFSKIEPDNRTKYLFNFGEAPSSFRLGQSPSLESQSQSLRLRPGYSHTV